MGEKEIKPPPPKPTDSIPGYPDELRTRERPGTGTNPPPNQPPTPPRQGGGGSSSGGGSYSGHIEFEDGYKMGRDADGTTWLQHPEGGRATWDAGSERWTRDDTGRRASNDWTQGHRPTDYGPKR